MGGTARRGVVTGRHGTSRTAGTSRRPGGGTSSGAIVGLGALGALLFATERANQNLSQAKPTTTTTAPVSQASSSTSSSPPSAKSNPTIPQLSTYVPTSRSAAVQSITDILKPLSPPDSVLEVLAGAGERGYIQPFLNRLVGRVPAGRTITSGIPVPSGFAIFAVGDVTIRVKPKSPNAYIVGFSEDNTPPSMAPLPFTDGVSFPAAFLLPAYIDVSFTIVGDPDLDLVYSGTAAAIGAPLTYANFIVNYLRTQVRAIDGLEQAAGGGAI